MTTIVPSLVYTDGQVLDVEKHNDNVYTTALNQGIMSTANGGLDATNLDSAFKVESEHLQIEEVAVARQDGRNTTVDCFQSAFARTATATAENINESGAAANLFVPLPGASLRFYQPYDATCAHLSWSMFLNPFTVRTYTAGTDAGDEFTAMLSPLTGIVLKFDGAPIRHTRREVPITAWVTNATTAAVSDGEAHCCQWWDMSHLITTGLSKGYHDLQVCMYMEVLDHEKTTAINRAYKSYSTITRFFQRMTLGITNAKVVTFL